MGRLNPPKINNVDMNKDNYNDVKNPSRRRELNRLLFSRRKKISKFNRLKRIKETGEKQIPRTIENTSEIPSKIDFESADDMNKLQN